MTDRVSCETCRWFDAEAPGAGDGWGLCRINPPVEDWPKVRRDDWCGHYQARPEEDEADG